MLQQNTKLIDQCWNLPGRISYLRLVPIFSCYRGTKKTVSILRNVDVSISSCKGDQRETFPYRKPKQTVESKHSIRVQSLGHSPSALSAQMDELNKFLDLL